MTDADNLWVGIGFVQVDGDLKAAFVVDARRYADDAAARVVISEAGALLRERELAGQFEFHDLDADEPVPYELPNWDEYRKHVLHG
ncbi:hypothetical protein GCM10009630_03940 [Kribbella jejuensis]|uniref:Uncharacterized protein n=1 Tax=Kribbella jejuensis TaxID=236068 RepID=A0A542EU60_9ACTN|nr:hypothetical protein [Kribbella jejuensis]TQJ18899.1 hypothetical protein FB475_3053 [Kribbella jejuensis]